LTTITDRSDYWYLGKARRLGAIRASLILAQSGIDRACANPNLLRTVIRANSRREPVFWALRRKPGRAVRSAGDLLYSINQRAALVSVPTLTGFAFGLGGCRRLPERTNLPADVQQRF
jgi:hypothetical protein